MASNPILAGNNAIDKVLNRLKNVRKNSNGWTALCPAHEDENPSLSIALGSKRVLIKCFAGCSLESILAALGLTKSDLYLSPFETKIVATYVYQNERGNPLFRVCRTEPKGFFQEHLENGKWVKGLGNTTKLVPYNLPRLLTVPEGKIVAVCEGEKDADTLTKLGIVATTSPMGAGNWRPEFAKYFQGRKVIIFADNDAPGRDYARTVALSLRDTAERVKIVTFPELPEHGDVSDFLQEHSPQELTTKIKVAPWLSQEDFERLRTETKEPPAQVEKAPRPIIVKLSDIKPEQARWLWKPFVPLCKLTLLEGDPGVGKTWVALVLTAAITRGDPLPGPDGVPRERREPASVLYMSAEDNLADTLRPRLDAVGADVNRVFALTGWEATDPATGKTETGAITLKSLDMIEEAAKVIRPVLVVIDPLQGYLGADVDMYRANETRPLLARLMTVAEKYSFAALCIRHMSKDKDKKALYRGLGSIDFVAAARSVLVVGKDPQNENRRVLAHSKSSLAQNGMSLAFEIRNDGFYWVGTSELTAEDVLAAPKSEEEKSALDEAADFLLQELADGPRRADEVMKAARKAGISEMTLRRAMKQVKVRKEKINIPGGKRGEGYWQWSLQDVQDIVEGEIP